MSDRALFPMGRLLMTPGVRDAVPFGELVTCLQRHQAGDWGGVGDDDRTANDRALRSGERLLSSYETPGGRVWVITECDRSATTILFPHEY